MNKKVFYIEDEPNLGKIVKETLERHGFEVVWETDGAKVLDYFFTYEPDICLLDIMLPNVDGYALCRQIREKYPSLPVIFVTAKTGTEDLVKGFNSGGTDYIKKPFSIEELLVRIKNQINLLHGKKTETEKTEILLGKYVYLPGRYELHSPSKTIFKLSQREQEILQIFAAAKNSIVDRKYLLREVWGDDSFYNSRNLDVYIRKLRKYFSEDPHIEILTLKSKGYLFLTGE